MAEESRPVSPALLVAARCLQIDGWTAEVVGAMRAAGLRPLLLKGPAVARWLYPDDPAARPYCDVDLLLAPDDLDQARRVLQRLGFVAKAQLPDAAPVHAQTWRRARDRALVDLHRTLHGCEEVPDDAVWAHVVRDVETIEVAGTSVEVPGAALRTLHVVLHLWPNDQPGSQTWRDLSRAVEAVDRAVWGKAAQVARHLGVEGEMADKLRRVSPKLADDLGLTGPAPLRLLFLREGLGTLPLAHLAELKGPRTKARYVRQMVLPPPAFMKERMALARAGRVGLVLAYPVRMVWYVLRLPQAARGWRRATRRHRSQPSQRDRRPPG